MNLNIVSSENLKNTDNKAYALFFVKQSIQFSTILTEEGEEQVETILKGMNDGPFEDLEYLEIDGCNTIFVDAAKERGLSALDHLRMAAYRLAKRAMKKQIATVSLFFAFFGKNGGKLNGLLDKEKGVSLVVSVFEIFRGNDIQIHALNVVNSRQ